MKDMYPLASRHMKSAKKHSKKASKKKMLKAPGHKKMSVQALEKHHEAEHHFLKKKHAHPKGIRD